MVFAKSAPRGLTTKRALLHCTHAWELKKKWGSRYTNSVCNQNSLYPSEHHTLAFYTKSVMLVRHRAAFLSYGIPLAGISELVYICRCV